MDFNDLRTQLNAIMDGIDNRETIQQFGALSQTIDKLEEQNKALNDDRTQLLSDYREVIKHISFPNQNSAGQADKNNDIMPKEVSFEDCLKDFCKTNNIAETKNEI